MNTKGKLNRFTYLDNTYKNLLETLEQVELDGRVKKITVLGNKTKGFTTGRVEMADIIFKERFSKMLKDMIIEVEREMSDFFDKNLED